MTSHDETAARDAIVAAARSLYQRSFTHGSTGNISVRVDNRILVTPTGSSLRSSICRCRGIQLVR